MALKQEFPDLIPFDSSCEEATVADQKAVSSKEVQQKIANILDFVADGGTVVVTRHDKPVADLVPHRNTTEMPFTVVPLDDLHLPGFGMTAEEFIEMVDAHVDQTT